MCMSSVSTSAVYLHALVVFINIWFVVYAQRDGKSCLHPVNGLLTISRCLGHICTMVNKTTLSGSSS